ncbi:RNA polymerase sigma factor [Herbidospora sp. NBRC 101105]|uniref:RNA polymerase sigma factor n=1 Tax=Herbidospora sp. NBRC 101105 TaxID=3032195 RepID=UPI0024A31028|nr:RNA polymerase sigma factor [Herbidospora sp. NBRC 101105]GLX93673.1 RNA polymerase sigma factor [Herbidospora sp. NBRC 101105]
MTNKAHHVVEEVWRSEAARVIAGLTRLTGDVGLAEELAQDALVAALEQWPRDGVPANPGAWLTTVAKRRAVDVFRRRERHDEKLAELARTAVDVEEQPDPDAIEDDVLRLLFVACHPVLTTQTRVALTLRLLGGLSTDEIARAFLSPEATMAQRISRAKKTLAVERVPFEVPAREELGERLEAVLEVVYLIFNEGYTATAGDDWVRPHLCEEALRLARLLEDLLPKEPEVHGLRALLEIQASRLHARTDEHGDPILLLDQDRTKWDRGRIAAGLAALERAGTGPYALQAAIAACHARAETAEATDWRRIAGLYDRLAEEVPSPVVELNRAVALAMAYGPAAGLALVDELADEPALRGYHLLPSVRGDLLARLGRDEEARAEFRRAAGLTRNERERALLLARAGVS